MITQHNIKITAIIPNYNSAEFIAHALQSLLSQTEAFDEIIIVDDGSTDNSLNIINEFKDKSELIRLIKHEKNEGVIAALNTGIVNSTGDYILLGAADDYYSSNIVELAKPIMKKFPSVGLICGDAIVHRYDVKKSFYRMLPFPPNQLISSEEFQSITQKSYVGFNSGGGMFINKNAILQSGLLNPLTRWHADWLLYFIAAFKQGIYYINCVFININVRQLGYSQGKQNKKIQNNVMLDTIRIIANQYPELWSNFKKAGLIPHYAIRYVILFFLDSTARRFLSKKLMWKLLINNNISIRVGRLLPYHVILNIRKLLKA